MGSTSLNLWIVRNLEGRKVLCSSVPFCGRRRGLSCAFCLGFTRGSTWVSTTQTVSPAEDLTRHQTAPWEHKKGLSQVPPTAEGMLPWRLCAPHLDPPPTRPSLPARCGPFTAAQWREGAGGQISSVAFIRSEGSTPTAAGIPTFATLLLMVVSSAVYAESPCPAAFPLWRTLLLPLPSELVALPSAPGAH